MLRPKNPIKHRDESLRPRFDLVTDLHPQQPNRNLQLRLICQYRLNPLKELPHDPGEHAASRQLPWWRLDQMRDGAEGVGHVFASSRIVKRRLFDWLVKPMQPNFSADDIYHPRWRKRPDIHLLYQSLDV